MEYAWEIQDKFEFDEDTTMTNAQLSAKLYTYDLEEDMPELVLSLGQVHGGEPCFSVDLNIGLVTVGDLQGLSHMFASLAEQLAEANLGG